MAIFWRDSVNWGKNRDFQLAMRFGSITGGVASVINKFRPRSTLTAALTWFRSVDGHAEENGMEFICTHW